MTQVIEDLNLPGGATPTVEVRIQLVGGGGQPVHGFHGANETIVGERFLTKRNLGIDVDGIWTENLVPNVDVTPSGTVYRINRRTADGNAWIDFIEVPDSEITLNVSDLLIDPPGAIESAALTTHVGAETVHGWTVTNGNILWEDGAILTGHDPKYFYPADMVGNATSNDNAGTLNAPPLWQFDPGVVERVKWVWTPGDGWNTYTVRFGWMNTGFSTGAVTWRYYERRTRVNSGNPEGNLLTNPTLISTFTATVPTLDANRYENLAIDVPVEPLTTVLSVIDRFATDATDTLNSDAALYIATATRTS
jgi:hypothetical protein